MVTGFRRSPSLPGPNSNSTPSSSGPKVLATKAKSYHVRSTTLPCPSHPLISHLDNELSALRAWHSKAEDGSAWLCSGLTQLEALHTTIGDLLHLPQSQDSLRRHAAWAKQLLEDFLRLADAYGAFRSVVLDAKELCSEAGVAIRRGNMPRLASCARSLKRAEKELSKLAPALQPMVRSPTMLGTASDAGEAELAGIMRDARVMTSMASATLFLRVAEDLSAVSTVLSSSFVPTDSWLRRLSLAKKNGTKDVTEWRREASKRMEDLDECMDSLENGSGRVFRTMINTRVSLLNILTPL